LKDATLIGTDLTNAILLDTDLTDSDRRFVNFEGSFFNCATLNTTNINATREDIKLVDSNFNKITSC
jgi:uncharacterized protein YjbI with pentapeptide repeats